MQRGHSSAHPFRPGGADASKSMVAQTSLQRSGDNTAEHFVLSPLRSARSMASSLSRLTPSSPMISTSFASAGFKQMHDGEGGEVKDGVGAELTRVSEVSSCVAIEADRNSVDEADYDDGDAPSIHNLKFLVLSGQAPDLRAAEQLELSTEAAALYGNKKVRTPRCRI